MDRSDTLALLDELCSSKPAFHGKGDDPSTFVNWQLADSVLAWLATKLRPGDRTLETGCGYSTVVFALAGTRHTVLSPRPYEHDRIRAWCDARGISTDGLRFIAGMSQDTLPHLEPEPLDLVLIDGDHSFPTPFLDWYFTAGRLRVGGIVVVDDTQLRTGALLREFLTSEAGRWTTVASFERTAAFEKAAEEFRAPGGWVNQPFCAPPLRLRDGPVRYARGKLRMRTRLGLTSRRG